MVHGGHDHGAGVLVGDGLGVGDTLGMDVSGDGGLDPCSIGDGVGTLVAVATGVAVGVAGTGAPEVVVRDVVGSGAVVVVGGDVVVGGSVVVVDGGAAEMDGVGAGAGASAATCEATCAAAAGGAAGGWAPLGTSGRPPLPLVPGGTGPGADGMGTTPVRYARAHCSTTST